MDLVIVDFDCHALAAQKERVGELLGLPGDAEVIFMEDADFQGNRWKIPESIAGNRDRCVFLTCLSGGIKKYHQDLFSGQPQILSWIIAVLDVEYDGYKKQFLGQIDQAFGESDAHYDVVFDCSGTLEETKKRCALPVKTRKSCLVVSKNRELAKQVRDVVEGYLPLWEVQAVWPVSEEQYRFADAVIAAGMEVTELAVPAPSVGVTRRFVWIERGFLDAEEREELTDEVGETMNGCGWNIPDYRSCLYCSELLYEKLHREIRDGEIGYSALAAHESFVMWDGYGLPMVREAYTADRIAGFLEENCCFTRIAGRINAKRGRQV